MHIHFTITGTIERYDDVHMDLPVVPRLGETVALPGLEQYNANVRTVVWYPNGDWESHEPNDGKPFVYIVLGSARP